MSQEIKLLFAFFVLMLGYSDLNAQVSDADKFVGVWSPSNKGWIGNIKISVREGKLYVQMKTDEGLKQITNVSTSGDEIIWSYIDETNYGKWHLGMWTWSSSGKREECILVDNGNGSYGTNGPPSKVYKRGRANREVSYWGFKGKLSDGNLEISSRHWGEYFDNRELLFEQSSNYVPYSTFTNW